MAVQDVVLLARDGSIYTVTINRPEKRNALTAEVGRRLSEAFRLIGEDPEARVAILRGAGEEAFCSGYDITELDELRDPEGADPIEAARVAMETCPVPVIAMICGYCTAGGLGLAAACDLRLAADTAHLGMTPARLGLVYRPEGVQRIVNVVGVPTTLELFYTARFIDAQRAREIGLVNQVVPAAQLESATCDLAREIARNAPLSIRGTKVTVQRLLSGKEMSAQTRKELLCLVKNAIGSEDFIEGRKAFAEKRRPVFRGR